MRSRPQLAGTALRVGFGIAGSAFLVAAFVQTWDRSRGALVPGWSRVLVALTVVTGGHAVAYRAWARLLPGARGPTLAAGFFVAQLGKYLPGAIWQAAGQVGYSVRAGVSLRRAATAFAVFAVTQAAAGAAFGAPFAVAGTRASTPVRVGALAAVALCAMLDRRWMIRAVRLLRRGGEADPAGLVPAQADILRSAGLSAVTAAANGAAFAIILAGLTGGGLSPAAATAYPLAWTVGFLAVPFPSGVGVREAALIAALGTTTGVAVLIAASVWLRLVTMLGETIMIVVTRWLLRADPAAARWEADRRP